MGEMGEKRQDAPVVVRSVVDEVRSDWGVATAPAVDGEADDEEGPTACTPGFSVSLLQTLTTRRSSARTFLRPTPRSTALVSGTGISTQMPRVSLLRTRSLSKGSAISAILNTST